jgi:dTDP-4-amino-4,6-dideoxygalactose transaminase
MNTHVRKEQLALYGGEAVRKVPLPQRRLMGEDEFTAVKEVFEESWMGGSDFAYQGRFEDRYTQLFCRFQGGGYADAVSSGSAAVFLALGALDLPHGCEVLYSPVTDPGAVSAAILQGYRLVLADAQPNSFNMGPAEFEAALTPNTRAAVISHIGGIPAEIGRIVAIAKSRGVRVVEDCSQAHGAMFSGRRVGCFGDIAAFSTMFSKNHSTGGCGGVVYTRDEGLYWRARSLADRGKPFQREDFDPKNPSTFLFPALNFNQDEISCAIGLSTLGKLQDIIDRRAEIIQMMNEGLRACRLTHPVPIPANAASSPFFHTMRLDTDRICVTKDEFGRALIAEGMWVNADYRYVVAEWGWVKPYIDGPLATPNATEFREQTVNILFNERFSDEDVRDVLACIAKVELFLGV